MEAASSSETSVSIYKATRCQYTEDDDLKNHRRENLITDDFFLFCECVAQGREVQGRVGSQLTSVKFLAKE
jgi:hypothetical protein